jgi:2-polyprenyl-3-methyl-5-hydroxy-6-metoxy-1,4-benzoquinol methylase
MIIKFGKLKQKYYKGILEKANYSLHDDVFSMMAEYIDADSYVLDFGCGQGAFSQRLADAGYQVDACDIDVDSFKASVNQFIQLDINKERISDNFTRKYDIVVAMEIIEHIENPWKFIRDIKSLLTPGGIIMLSTPNISNFASRLRFMMRGTFLSFERAGWAYGHITPLTSLQLEYIFMQNELTILKKRAVGTLPLFHFDNISLFNLFRNTVMPLLLPFLSGDKKGWCNAYVLKVSTV